MEDNLLHAYAAGLFDGEGCVYIGKTQRSGRRLPCYRMFCKISMTNDNAIKLLHEHWGGHYGVNKANVPKNYKPLYNWTVPAKKAAKFLLDVLPYLRIKHEQARLALEFQAHMSSSGKYRIGMYSKELKGQEIVPPEVISLRDSFHLRMKELNKRGVNVQ